MNFYEKNHKDYYQSTVGVNPSSFLTPLTVFLEPNASILDIGCGSGRDLLWLAEHGFCPTGFEQSPSLADLARTHSQQPVIEGDFCSYDFSSLQFNALVLVGALVHQSREEFPELFRSICQALVPAGYVLLTMKEGSGGMQTDDGRYFTLWSCRELESVFASIGLEVIRFTRNISKIRSTDIWLGYVLRLTTGSERERVC